MASRVKPKRRRGYTRISRKHQVTIPVDALAKAGLEPGDELKVEAEGSGRLALQSTRAQHWTERYAGTVPAEVFPPGYLEKLRAEWDE